MQTYDILMLVVLASATLFGAIKGFAWQVASLASIVLSFFVANYFRNDVAKLINAEPPWNMFLAMLLLYFGTSLAIWMVFRLLSTSIDKIKLKEFDRQLGAGFGLLKGAALCCVITMFAMTLLGPAQQQAIANSRSGYYIGRGLSQAGAILPEEVKQVIGPYIERVNRQLEQGRDPNYVPDASAPGSGTQFDRWGRALDARMTELGQEWGQGSGLGTSPNGVATDTSRNDGGILRRIFPPQEGQPSPPPTTSPSYAPPGGWPVSTPPFNPNASQPGGVTNPNYPNTMSPR